MKSIRKYFFAGIATALPLVITIWLLIWLLAKIDILLLKPFLVYIKNYLDYPGVEILARVVILAVFMLLLSFLGFLVSFIFFRNFLNFMEKIFLKFPIVGKIYKSIKHISDAVMGQGRNVFKKVVLVEYPHQGRFCIGFLTSEAGRVINNASGHNLAAVFIPTTPNPTSGMLVYFPRESIKELDLTVEEGMRIVISAGTVIVGEDD
ncbi:MAG: DUF502 domain-containing protein [Candidatus Omnitrophica bacterium]|nr:DUF502 domain-containing protein [Candidatus Omnitrophota bacterium]